MFNSCVSAVAGRKNAVLFEILTNYFAEPSLNFHKNAFSFSRNGSKVIYFYGDALVGVLMLQFTKLLS